MSKIRNVSGVAVWLPVAAVTVDAGDEVDVKAKVAAELCAGPLFDPVGQSGKQSTDDGEEKP